MESSLSNGFLSHTLNPPALFSPYQGELKNGVIFIHHHIGILEFIPPNSSVQDNQELQTNKAIVVSCGIHGDETIPIEIVDNIVSSILNLSITPKNHLLFIIAHPKSIQAETRYINENLNRLFHVDENKNITDSLESIIARSIRDQVTAFFSRYSKKEKWHLDCHSAIRNSRHHTFAVLPPMDYLSDKEILLNWLSFAQIEAALFNKEPSSTFSAWTNQKFHSFSATIEIGRVSTLFLTDLSQFEPIKLGLIALIVGNNPAYFKQNLICYLVTDSVIKHASDFTLHFPEDTPNFTFFNTGDLISTESRGNCYSEGEYVIFPNEKVALGQRACLLAKMIS